MKDYEIALLQGKAITETGQKPLDDEAFAIVNCIACAVLESGKTHYRGKDLAKAPRRQPGRKGPENKNRGRSR
jgi:hypothetical protein